MILKESVLQFALRLLPIMEIIKRIAVWKHALEKHTAL